MYVLKNKNVITRKEHTCWGCAEKLSKGTKMNYSVIIYDGDFHADYFCMKCIDVINNYEIGDNPIYFGELKEFHD